MATIVCPYCDENHVVSDEKFSKAVGKVVKCRTCKESFQVQPLEEEATIDAPVDVQLLPNAVNPVRSVLDKTPRPYEFPDRTRVQQLVQRMWNREFLVPGLATLAIIAGFIRAGNVRLPEDYDKVERFWTIGIGMFIASRFINERLRRHRATLEIQMNIERLLVTIANNTSSHEWSQSMGSTVRDDAQKASESASTGDGKAT